MDTHSQCQPNRTQTRARGLDGTGWRDAHERPHCSCTLLTVPEEGREEGDGVRGTGVPKGHIPNTELIPHLLKEDVTS